MVCLAGLHVLFFPVSSFYISCFKSQTFCSFVLFLYLSPVQIFLSFSRCHALPLFVFRSPTLNETNAQLLIHQCLHLGPHSSPLRTSALALVTQRLGHVYDKHLIRYLCWKSKKNSKCILKSHMQFFPYGFTVITLKRGTIGLKKGHFNIMCAHVKFTCHHISLHVQLTTLSVHIIITKITS